jgi:small nuclear ribonucleoprotein (snRNP)-like protein
MSFAVLDRSWIDKQVFVRLSYNQVYNGILNDFGDDYIKIGNTVFNLDHVVSISLVDNRTIIGEV